MHIPVLKKEVVEYLDPGLGDKIIDSTFAEGGHSLEIINHIGPEGKVLGIETDSELFKRVKEESRINKFDNFILVNDSYTNLEKIIKESGFEKIDGILFDLGLSSWHLEKSGRGFTFQKLEPLDMRFNPKEFLTAADIVNNSSFDELMKVLREYGEERFAKPIVKKILEERKQKRIKTTSELVDVIESVVPGWYKRKRIHFATKTFQALRIAVNNELSNLTVALNVLPNVLKADGRVVVISFHGLEDKIVKNKFREWKEEGQFEILTKKPIVPTQAEIESNPRSRSAKLRAARKLK